jgi:hypothetical protein
VDVAGAVLEPEDLPDLRQVREPSLQAIEHRSFLLSRRIAQRRGGVLPGQTQPLIVSLISETSSVCVNNLPVTVTPAGPGLVSEILT